MHNQSFGHPALPGGQFLVIGNPLTDGTWNYTWEKGRQLRQMRNGSMRILFAYDASGMRIKKTVNETDVTSYTYHGKNLVHLKKTGGTEMHFYYDAQNRPSVVNYNGSALKAASHTAEVS